MLFADEQLDEEDLTAMKDDASKFNDEAKEMEELPGKYCIAI